MRIRLNQPRHRDASADRDRTDTNVTVIDVPAFVAGFGRTAAGEGGHGAIEAPRATGRKPGVSRRPLLRPFCAE